jgi:hypothetical protein
VVFAVEVEGVDVEVESVAVQVPAASLLEQVGASTEAGRMLSGRKCLKNQASSDLNQQINENNSQKEQ